MVVFDAFLHTEGAEKTVGLYVLPRRGEWGFNFFRIALIVVRGNIVKRFMKNGCVKYDMQIQKIIAKLRWGGIGNVWRSCLPYPSSPPFVRSCTAPVLSWRDHAGSKLTFGVMYSVLKVHTRLLLRGWDTILCQKASSRRIPQGK